MIENKINNNIYYTFKNFKYKDIDHLFSSRIGWSNENKLINSIFNSNKKVVSLKQVHGNKVVLIDENFMGKFDPTHLIEGDGLITNLDNVILKTYHADCTPIYFVDSKNKVIGLAHAGWRGTYANIMSEMLDKMTYEYGSILEDVEIFIGPAIKGCCYEISRDLFEQFKGRYNNYLEAFSNKGNNYNLDLQTINYNQALDKGVLDEKIYMAEICTSCNIDRFYSYRKENGTNGRLVTAISLKNRGV